MADHDDRGRARDLVLAPNEFAFISDETKGNINVYVGPHKTSLANTDRPVTFTPYTKRFERCTLDEATQTMAIAPEGWYLVLKNPAKDNSHPRTGALNNLPDLQVGRKVNTPGPVNFALWPGQMARVLQGHHLRSNQYLVVRVYDEEAAKANWEAAVIRTRTSEEAIEGEDTDSIISPEDLAMGAHLVIRGTVVSFHIPPTGIEVLADENGRYVREAITLERLEYCILLDEDGNKRFVRGPAVVFPRPTETFVSRNGERKFRALELNENSGIFVKVIAPYERDGKKYTVGEELFITGKDQMIYFPRPEHAIVKYGKEEIHYGIAIPAGEGRYVLDRNSGQIRLQRGPSIFLPDPRKEVVVRRALDARQVKLWFPGNTEALEVNQRLQDLRKESDGEHLVDEQQARRTRLMEAPRAPTPAPTASKAQPTFAGDDFSRKQSFTQPRTIVLDTRYDGAVSIGVWTGYAVMVLNRTGDRQVIVGPHTHLLEYDETLQAMELSTGTPKNDSNLLRTAYLRVLNNKISDVIEAETRDLCQVELKLSYRVNFEGEPSQWFNVENYVKFLTDHLRSLIRNAVKQQGVEHFYAQSASILRDTVLGLQNEEGKRPGRFFEENGMRVYDVEVLDVTLGDEDIAQMLLEAQHATVHQTLQLAAERRKLALSQETESTQRAINELQAGTRIATLQLKQTEQAQAHTMQLEEIQASTAQEQGRKQLSEAQQAMLDLVHAAELARKESLAKLQTNKEDEVQQRYLARLEAEVKATVSKAEAVSPDLIAALQAFSDRALTAKVAESMAPLAILGGESVAEVIARLLQGTPLARFLPSQPALPDAED